MKLTFLGTRSGTEPFPNRQHTSLMVEQDGALYLLDAGEGCSYTAHNLGLDLHKIKAVAISHPHIDHISGLANLLWTMEKLRLVRKQDPFFPPVCVRVPDAAVLDNILTFVEATDNFRFRSNPLYHFDTYGDGVLFDDGSVKIEAFHNHHMPDTGDGLWHSFTFRISAGGKRFVYSGDVGPLTDLDAAIGEGCDALTIETGHHKIADIHTYTAQKNIGKVYFTHCGREILYDEDGAPKKVAALFGDRAAIATDGLTVTV